MKRIKESKLKKQMKRKEKPLRKAITKEAI
jgi:hypothetical protein